MTEQFHKSNESHEVVTRERVNKKKPGSSQTQHNKPLIDVPPNKVDSRVVTIYTNAYATAHANSKSYGMHVMNYINSSNVNNTLGTEKKNKKLIPSC